MSAQLAYKEVAIQPRVIRLRDAPDYLGMDKNRFNDEVRPNLTEFNVGIQGIGFDRLELDAWIEEYINRNGRRRNNLKGSETCQNAQPASRKGAISGTSKRKLEGMVGFERALALVSTKKPKGT